MVVIFDYKINKNIGKGSFSHVYSAYNINDPLTEYAIKTIKINKLNDQLKSKIKYEVDILKKISHENIIKLHDSFYHEGIIYIILERCNTDLSIEIKDNFNKISNEIKVKWITQLISAIIYLHYNYILHRDLKTQNIMLTVDNNIKIIDFGFSRYIDSIDLNTTLCGSPLYMSPELFSQPTYDYKNDYWSLGIIIYNIIIGKMPFDAKNMVDLMSKLKNITDIKIPINISNEYDNHLINLIESMLITSPKYRISFEELQNNIFVKKNNLNILSDEQPHKLENIDSYEELVNLYTISDINDIKFDLVYDDLSIENNILTPKKEQSDNYKPIKIHNQDDLINYDLIKKNDDNIFDNDEFSDNFIYKNHFSPPNNTNTKLYAYYGNGTNKFKK